MEITNKKLVAGVATVLIIGFAFGRWSAPEKIKIEKEQVQIDMKTKDTENKSITNTDRDKKLKTIITETTKPDGTKTKTTEITEDTTTKRNTKTDDKQQETDTKINLTKESKEVDYKKPSLVLRGLVGVDAGHLSTNTQPIYGGAVDKNVFGPIGVGAWGLSNGTCGLSLGITF